MDKHHIGFAIVGSVMTILFVFTVNVLTTPDYTWFIYPAFMLLLWPGGLIFIKSGKYKQYSVFGSILIIGFLIAINYLHSPQHPWFLYAAFPVIWWPISVICGRKAKKLTFALIGSISTILYYAVLNVAMSPQYPWAIYPAFAVLWWPLVLYYARKKNYFGLSVSASLLTTLFFIIVNVISSPYTIWAIYPIFVILWWPLTMYYYHYKRNEVQTPTKG